MANVVVNGLMTNYQTIGTGKKVLVLLHGWGDSAQTFSRLAEYLHNQYTLAILDLPGFGTTETPHEAWDLGNYSDFVASWLKKIGITPPEAVLGHSFGGAVAIKAISKGDVRSKKLILIASAGVRNRNTIRKNILRSGAKVGKIPLYLLPADKAKKIKLKLYKRIGSDMLLIPHMRETFKKTVAEDLQSDAERITAPTLLIYGSKDRETPPLYGSILKNAIPNSKLEITEGAGHFLHQEKSEEVAKHIKEFLK